MRCAKCAALIGCESRSALTLILLDVSRTKAASQGIAEKAPELPGEHRCQWFCKFYKHHQDLKAHHTRGCDCAPRSKIGGIAEKDIKKAKMRRIHKAADKVVLGGVPLKNSFNFKYLGFEYQANGCWRHAVNVNMVLARTRFGKMYNIWNST